MTTWIVAIGPALMTQTIVAGQIKHSKPNVMIFASVWPLSLECKKVDINFGV